MTQSWDNQDPLHLGIVYITSWLTLRTYILVIQLFFSLTFTYFSWTKHKYPKIYFRILAQWNKTTDTVNIGTTSLIYSSFHCPCPNTKNLISLRNIYAWKKLQKKMTTCYESHTRYLYNTGPIGALLSHSNQPKIQDTAEVIKSWCQLCSSIL